MQQKSWHSVNTRRITFRILKKIFPISEKLEDPENYATVVDDKELTNNATLYMDPMNMKP